MNIKKIIDDERSEMRYSDLKARGVGVKHYLNQIEKSKGDKQIERAQTFYRLALQDGFGELANAIKSQYPDIYATEDVRTADKEKEESEKREREEAAQKAKEEAEAKKPLNVLRANAAKTKRSPCYGLSDDEVHSYADRLFNELVPGSGPAKTVAGELLRAWNDLMYRWYNDGDWVEKGGGFNGDESFSPRSVSNMKYLTSHGAGQIAYFFENCDSVHDFERKVERMLLNQIVKKDLDKQPNSTDSRSYWRPGRSY